MNDLKRSLELTDFLFIFITIISVGLVLTTLLNVIIDASFMQLISQSQVDSWLDATFWMVFWLLLAVCAFYKFTPSLVLLVILSPKLLIGGFSELSGLGDFTKFYLSSNLDGALCIAVTLMVFLILIIKGYHLVVKGHKVKQIV